MSNKLIAGVTGRSISRDPWENFAALRKIGFRTSQGAAGQLENMDDPAEAFACYQEMGMVIHSVSMAPVRMKPGEEPKRMFPAPPKGGFPAGPPKLPTGNILPNYIDAGFEYRCTDEQIEDTIALCEKYGTNIVVSYSTPCTNDMWCPDDPCEADVFFMALDEMEAIAEKFAKAGIRYCYHNHDCEFKLNFGGLNPMEHLLARTSALSIELDVGWVQAGGWDPVKFYERAWERVASVHAKDLRTGSRIHPLLQRPAPDFCALGSGIVDFDGLFKSMVEHGMTAAIVEQDYLRNLSDEESLTAAYLNMKETGYVE